MSEREQEKPGFHRPKVPKEHYDNSASGLGTPPTWLAPVGEGGGGGGFAWEDVGLGCGPTGHTSYPVVVSSLAATRDLRGYWRLGEGASPYRDTSGYNPSNPGDVYINVGTVGSTPVTANVTPGLLPPSDDDGAVGFNVQGNDSGCPVRPFLEDPTGASKVNFNFGSGHPKMSAVAVIKPSAASIGFWGGVVSMVNGATGLSVSGGWALQVRFPTAEVEFVRNANSGTPVRATTVAAVSVGQISVIAATYDGSVSRVYVNGVFMANASDTASVPTITSGSPYNLGIGGYFWTNLWQPFYGVLDEVTVWGDTLTASEVSSLSNAVTG